MKKQYHYEIDCDDVVIVEVERGTSFAEAKKMLVDELLCEVGHYEDEIEELTDFLDEAKDSLKHFEKLLKKAKGLKVKDSWNLLG